VRQGQARAPVVVPQDGLATERDPALRARPGAGWSSITDDLRADMGSALPGLKRSRRADMKKSIVPSTVARRQAHSDLIAAGRAVARRRARARILLTPAAEAGPVRPDRETLSRGGPVVAEGRTGAGTRSRSARQNPGAAR
jgi:hypothetical protein